MNELIAFRNERILGDQKIIDHINGVPVEDLNYLTRSVVNSLMEHNFRPNNITFSELSNSGNLNLISNESIKFLLLELEELFKANELNIDHETFDYREYISKCTNRNIDLDQLFTVLTGQKTARDQGITHAGFKDLFNTQEYKNGLVIMTILSDAYIQAYSDMKMRSETIIDMIEKEG